MLHISSIITIRMSVHVLQWVWQQYYIFNCNSLTKENTFVNAFDKCNEYLQVLKSQSNFRNKYIFRKCTSNCVIQLLVLVSIKKWSRNLISCTLQFLLFPVFLKQFIGSILHTKQYNFYWIIIAFNFVQMFAECKLAHWIVMRFGTVEKNSDFSWH